MRHYYFISGWHDKEKTYPASVRTIILINAHTSNEYYYMHKVLYCFKEVFSSQLLNLPNSHILFYNGIYIPIILKIMLAYFANA